VTQLCAIAEVSRKSYYFFLQSLTKPDPDAEILRTIQEIQNATGFSCGYRQITMQLNQRIDGGPINEKRVHRIMQEYNLLSSVRRKKFTPEQYLRRRERKENVPPNLLKRNFFSGTPRRIFCTDITYLFCLEQTWYL
jgi:putative transposase